MPDLPPKYFTPGPWTLYNGAPVRADHANEIDRYAAWMVSVNRSPIPLLIGHPLVSGATYEHRTMMPHYCEALAFALQVSGAGTVTVTVDSGDDASNSVVLVEQSEGNTLDEAGWVWALTPIPGAANGFWRALDITDQSSPHLTTVTITVTDGGGLSCYVHAALLYPAQRTQGSALPA